MIKSLFFKRVTAVVLIALLLLIIESLFVAKKPLSVSSKPYFNRQISVVAHRGGALEAPEESLFAYKKNVEAGIDELDIDLQMTKDGEVILLHDTTLDRTTNGKGYAKDYTLSQLKHLDAGYYWSPDNGASYPFRGKAITIPTFEEFLINFPQKRVQSELKSDDKVIAKKVCQLIQKYNMTDDTLVFSFNKDVNQAFHTECPEVVIGSDKSAIRNQFISSHILNGIFYSPSVNAYIVPEYYNNTHIVTEQFVSSAHMHNIKVYVWTVND